MQLTKKVTVDQPVDHRIAAMVHFVRRLEHDGRIKSSSPISDDDLVKLAEDFWNSLHGED